MHGRRTEVDEPFVTPEGFHIMWPADCTSGSSDVPQKEIRNCRCTLLSRVKGFEGDTVTSSPDMGDMTFEEWQNAKAVPDTRRDRDQYESYKKLLKSKAPRSFKEFQNIKYNDAAKWASLKKQASEKRVVSSRNTAFGKLRAVIGGAPLNNRQSKLLSALQSNQDYVIIKKKDVNFRDMCALAAHEGVEFAMLSRRGERMLIRGTLEHVDAINGVTAKQYRNDGWRWSGHVHVLGGLVPSSFDIYIMKLFGQNQSALFDLSGNRTVIRGR